MTDNMAAFAERSPKIVEKKTSTTPKAVSISDSTPTFAMLPEPAIDDDENNYSRSPKQHRVSLRKKLSGRLPPFPPSPALSGQSRQAEVENVQEHHRHHAHVHAHRSLVEQVHQWLHREKAKSAHRLLHRTGHRHHVADKDGQTGKVPSEDAQSETELALEELDKLLESHMNLGQDMMETPFYDAPGSYFPRRRPSSARILRATSIVGASSDVEQPDYDPHVPGADVVLDNSKTLSYGAGDSSSELDLTRSVTKVAAREGWHLFKNEILKLTHTLRLKGWRRVPFERSADIQVERLSGALTNAVYVVTPPTNLPTTPSTSSLSSGLKKPPPKLLLRIYGPQVEHLIDRESELQILRRLARKRIGPRMLGTFTNGRFEEYLHAKPLTAKDLRSPETSKMIAKRMRELHDGVELLESERKAKPFVWQNWDSWVTRCEEVIEWLDEQIVAHKGPVKKHERWREGGLVCGVPWKVFRQTVDRYRKWLEEQYGGEERIQKQLVFSHNDTQYGNILRLEPSGESPLLLAANEHKQLVVIDFEYANANCPGLEFANHFTEWCYNYHAPVPHICQTTKYPTPDEQARFLSAYVAHRPLPQLDSTSDAPSAGHKAGTAPSSGSVANFMLDSRARPDTLARSYTEESATYDAQIESEVKRLMHETRLWRVANSAQWVAWGIVQAKVEGMEEALARRKVATDGEVAEGGSVEVVKDSVTDGLVEQVDEEGEEVEAEFDYLAYAQERAMFFWGDVLGLGLVAEADLPKELREKIKRVVY